MPSDAAITEALRQTVRKSMRLNEDVTVNGVRARVAEELDLDEDFFKDSTAWKAKSKEIISSAFEDPPSDTDDEDDTPPARAGTKRRSTERIDPPPKKAKRQSSETAIEEDDSAAEDVARPKDKAPKAARRIQSKPKKSAQSKAKAKTQQRSSATVTSDDSDAESVDPVAKPDNAQDEGDDSDMSVVIDEAPPKKRQSKKKASPGPKKRQTKPKNSGAPLSAEEEQVKTLQSQLVKCGVKKLWHRELAACDTPQEKIRHLKGMLSDVGMTGRFSAEKAEQIKEARELAADMEAAKDYQKKWGADGDHGRGRRRRTTTQSLAVDEDSEEEAPAVVEAGAATGLVDFGDSGDSDW